MILNVKISPNAKTNQIIEWDGQILKLKIAAPPLEGKANQELIRFLAKQLALAPSSLDILSGHTSKTKKIAIPLDLDTIVQKLNLQKQGKLL
jgi:uncharacterized protein (TIGR00251 family)